MAEKSAADFDEFDDLEGHSSELDAPPALEIILSDKPKPKFPRPVKPIIRTRGSIAVTSPHWIMPGSACVGQSKQSSRVTYSTVRGTGICGGL